MEQFQKQFVNMDIISCGAADLWLLLKGRDCNNCYNNQDL